MERIVTVMTSAGAGVCLCTCLRASTPGRCPFWAPASNSRLEVNRMPLMLPKQDSDTNRGTSHGTGGIFLWPNVCKQTKTREIGQQDIEVMPTSKICHSIYGCFDVNSVSKRSQNGHFDVIQTIFRCLGNVCLRSTTFHDDIFTSYSLLMMTPRLLPTEKRDI